MPLLRTANMPWMLQYVIDHAGGNTDFPGVADEYGRNIEILRDEIAHNIP